MDEQARRASSFGQVADTYETFRPGPPAAAVDWILDGSTRTVVDLGAGTGALSRLLVDRAQTVIAVEPDASMRQVLEASVASIDVRQGTGEHLPVEDGSVDAIIASASWHWVDPALGLAEAARALRVGGTLGALWTGPDPDGAFMQQAQAALSAPGSNSDSELRATVTGERNPPRTELIIPAGAPFAPQDHEQFRYDLELTADQLIGLLATLSWVILLDEPQRLQMFETARRLLRDALGIEGEVTATVEFLSETYRTRRTA